MGKLVKIRRDSSRHKVLALKIIRQRSLARVNTWTGNLFEVPMGSHQAMTLDDYVLIPVEEEARILGIEAD
jgi:hypothetical protein